MPDGKPKKKQELTFKAICQKVIEQAKANNSRIHREFSAEGHSYEDAVQSAIAKVLPDVPMTEIDPQTFAELTALIAAQIARDENTALRRNARHLAISALHRDNINVVELGPDALRAVSSRQAIAIIRSELPRDENLLRIFDCALPSEDKPEHFELRETSRIAEHLGLSATEVQRHKETISTVGRRVLARLKEPS